MDSQERSKVVELVDKLKRITFIVQVAPFVYCGLYLIAIALYLFAPLDVIRTTDSLLYVSPVTMLLCLVLSVALKMCRWHRAACLLPLIPQAAILIDRFVVEFGRAAATVHLVIMGVLTILLICFAYKVFYGCKERTA